MNPAAVLHQLEALLEAKLPPGVSPEYARAFMERHRAALLASMSARPQKRALGHGRIVTLNLGLGRDSFAMLCLLLEGKLIAQGTKVELPDVSAVITSDTGEEWAFTYQNHLPLARELCRQAGLTFYHLKKPPAEGEQGWKAWLERKKQDKDAPHPWRRDPGETILERAEGGYYHLRPPIREDYQSRQTVISLKRQDCTGNHKVLPIRRLIEDLAWSRFGVESNAAWGRDVRKKLRRPHLTLIGYAADETHRYADLDPDGGPSYVEEAYPLVELGITKAGEQEILGRWGMGHLLKTGCKCCPFQPISWYWALRETDPAGWEAVLEYERQALSRNPNMTVLPSGPRLEVAVERWRRENPEASVEAVLTKSYERCGRKHGSKTAPTTTVMEVLPAKAATETPPATSKAGVRSVDRDRPDPLIVAVQARVLLRSRGTALERRGGHR